MASIKRELSTFIFSASPRQVIALYDFIMAIFASNHNALPSDAVTPMSEASAGDAVDVDSNLTVSNTKHESRNSMTHVDSVHFLNRENI